VLEGPWSGGYFGCPSSMAAESRCVNPLAFACPSQQVKPGFAAQNVESIAVGTPQGVGAVFGFFLP